VLVIEENLGGKAGNVVNVVDGDLRRRVRSNEEVLVDAVLAL
jgi:hypothetical protein